MTDEQIASLRHDLRNPLAVILGFADLLASEREISSEQRREYADRIRAAAAEIRRELDAGV